MTESGGHPLKPGWTRVRFGDVVRQVKARVDPATVGISRYVAGEQWKGWSLNYIHDRAIIDRMKPEQDIQCVESIH